MLDVTTMTLINSVGMVDLFAFILLISMPMMVMSRRRYEL